MSQHRLAPYPTLVVVCLGWGTIPLVVSSVHLPAAAIVAVRLWVSALALGVVVLTRRGRDERPALLSRRPVLCGVAAAVLAAHWTLLFAAYQHAPAGTVILIVYLAPVAIAAAAPRVLGERVGPRTLAALVLATAGFALVTGPAVGSASADGLALALGAAVLFAVLVLVSKPLSEIYGGLRLAFLEMGGAGLLLIPVAATARWGSPQPAWAWLLVLGLVHTAIGTGLYLDALGRVPATHVGILGYLEPAGVVVCAWLVLGQRPSVLTVVGGLLIAGAGVMVVATAPVLTTPEVPVRAPR